MPQFGGVLAAFSRVTRGLALEVKVSVPMLRQVSRALLLILLLSRCGPTAALAGEESGTGQRVPCESVQVTGSSVPPAANITPLPPVPETTIGVAAPVADHVDPQGDVTLRGAVCQVNDAPADNSSVDQLFSMTLKDEQDVASGKANQHFRIDFHKLVYKSRNILNYMFDYRAFGPSTEASNLILEEHVKSKGAEAQAYNKQRELDDKHLQTVGSIMQLGMGVGMPATARGQRLIDSSLASLRDLVGEKQADTILVTLQKYGKTLTFPKSLADKELWDIQQREQQVQKIVKSAVGTDQTVLAARKDLHKYNCHGKVAITATGLLQTALSVASFTPTFVAPAAETAYFLLVMATGGPEQDKLLRELYLSKCIESRVKVINEKAHLAIDTYHIGLLSENPVLVGCAQSMVRQMCGEATMQEVFGGSEPAPAADSSSVVSRTGAAVH